MLTDILFHKRRAMHCGSALTALVTDKGEYMAVNQDACMLRAAVSSGYGRVMLAGVFDGCGGLSNGEIASSYLSDRESEWFAHCLPQLLEENSDIDDAMAAIAHSQRELLEQTSDELWKYGQDRGIRLGTTAVVLLQIGKRYVIWHVGDSRAYVRCGADVMRLTRDHSYVQQQIDDGLMTEEEAESSADRSVLVMSVGATKGSTPDIRQGVLEGDAVFLLCSDGFWKELKDHELAKLMEHRACRTRARMDKRLKEAMQLCRSRGETDNISAVMIRTGKSVDRSLCTRNADMVEPEENAEIPEIGEATVCLK